MANFNLEMKPNTIPIRTSRSRRIQLSALAFMISGILFALYPAIRPFSDEKTLLGAAAFASTEWMLSHVMANLAFILMALGLLGLYVSLQGTRADGLAYYSLVLSWIGIGLTLPFYGAEVFGLSAVGQEAIRLQNSSYMAPQYMGSQPIRIAHGLLITIGCIWLAI